MRTTLSLLGLAALTGLVMGGCLPVEGDGDGSSIGDVIGDLLSSNADPAVNATAGTDLVVLADINNDGLTDMASASSESQTVQIHLRDPLTGDFASITVAGGAPLTGISDLELVDLTGDGKLDIAVLANETGLAEPGAGGALIFLFQGDDPAEPDDWNQVPAPGQRIPTNLTFPGTAVTDLLTGDMDGRSGTDLVAVSDDEIRLFRHPGYDVAEDPTAWESELIEDEKVGGGNAAVVDLDNDGDNDVAMCDPSALSFNVRWLQNPRIGPSAESEEAAPTFLSDAVDPRFEATAGAKAVAIGDINNDGLIDAVSVSDENQPVQLHINNLATGNYDTYSIAGGAPLVKMKDVKLADLNSDGRLDIVVLVNDTGLVAPDGCNQLGAVVVLIQGASPIVPNDWTQGELYFCSTTTGLTDIAVTEMDGQNGPDIVVAANMSVLEPGDELEESADTVAVVKPTADITWPGNFVFMFANPGPATAADPTTWTEVQLHGDVNEIEQVETADLDLDGDRDVVAVYPTAISLNIRWLRNPLADTGIAAVLSDFWEFRMLGQQEGGADAVAVGRIDEDEYVDVAVSQASTGLTQWFRNPGSTGLVSGATQVPWYVFNIGVVDHGQVDQLQLVDLDDDGKLECFVAASNTGTIMGFRQQDDIENIWESFEIASVENVDELGRTAFDDFDGDGRLDFVVPIDREGLTEDRIVMYSSIASSLWSRQLIGQQDGGADLLAAGDLDADGMIDVAVASAADGLIQWFRNPGVTELNENGAQIPWEVFTLGSLADISIGGQSVSGDINQMQLVDLDGDDLVDLYLTASGTAYQFYRCFDAEEPWSGAALFKTDPSGDIGQSGFLNLDGNTATDIIAPVNRDGLTDDAIIIFTR